MPPSSPPPRPSQEETPLLHGLKVAAAPQEPLQLDALLFHLAQSALEAAAALLPRLGRIPTKSQAPSAAYLTTIADYRRHIAFAVTSLRSIVALADDPTNGHTIVRAEVELSSRCLLAELLMRELEGCSVEAERVLGKGVRSFFHLTRDISTYAQIMATTKVLSSNPTCPNCDDTAQFARYPDLRYRLCSLQIELLLSQGQHKLAKSTLRRHIADLSTATPDVVNLSHWLFHFHLLYIDLSPYPTSATLKDVVTLAKHRGEETLVMATRLMVARSALINGDVAESQRMAEELKGILEAYKKQDETTARPIPKAFALQAAILVGFHLTHCDNKGEEAKAVMRQVHGWLDEGSKVDIEWLRASKDVILKVRPRSRFYNSTFLFSVLVSRDAAGKQVKNCLLFHEAGLDHVKTRWHDGGDAEDVLGGLDTIIEEKRHLVGVRVDLLLAKIDILLCRSLFAVARDTLAEVIELVEMQSLWSTYGSRIVYRAGMLRQAVGDVDIAVISYRFLTSHLPPTSHLHILSSAFTLLARIGQGAPVRRIGHAGSKRRRLGPHSPQLSRSSYSLINTEDPIDLEELGQLATSLVARCTATSLPFLAFLSDLLEAIAVPTPGSSSARAKRHLTSALSYAEKDVHARSLILALLTAQYAHTANEQAVKMAASAAMLAKSLGAEKKVPPGQEDRMVVGQASLGLWLAQHLLGASASVSLL